MCSFIANQVYSDNIQKNILSVLLWAQANVSEKHCLQVKTKSIRCYDSIQMPSNAATTARSHSSVRI